MIKGKVSPLITFSRKLQVTRPNKKPPNTTDDRTEEKKKRKKNIKSQIRHYLKESTFSQISWLS